MRIAAVLLLVAACKQGDGALYDLTGGGGPGGPGGGGAGAADADLGDSGSTADVIAGVVCVVADPREPGTCTNGTSAGGLTVTLDGNTALTNADGTFQIDAPKSSTLIWTVSGGQFAPSITSYSASHVIPIVKADDYTNLKSESGTVAESGYGDVFVHVQHASANVATVVAVAAGTPLYSPLYDGTTADAWQVTGTGSFGMVWLNGVIAGSTSVTLTPTGGTATSVANIPVGDGAVTWVSVELP